VSAICPGKIPGNPAYKIASELEASLSVAFDVFPPSLSLAIVFSFLLAAQAFQVSTLHFPLGLYCSGAVFGFVGVIRCMRIVRVRFGDL
jgi:hypothetical protein